MTKPKLKPYESNIGINLADLRFKSSEEGAEQERKRIFNILKRELLSWKDLLEESKLNEEHAEILERNLICDVIDALITEIMEIEK